LVKVNLRRDEKVIFLFQNVYPSYASKVNFKPGDKIVKINDKDLKNYDDLKLRKYLIIKNKNQKFPILIKKII
jgi:C-terminal processing protease CtpA/Prc